MLLVIRSCFALFILCCLVLICLPVVQEQRCRLGKLMQGADSLLFSPALLVTLQVTLRIPPTLSRLQLLYLQKGGVRQDGWVGFGPFLFKPLTLGVYVCVSLEVRTIKLVDWQRDCLKKEPMLCKCTRGGSAKLTGLLKPFVSGGS